MVWFIATNFVMLSFFGAVAMGASFKAANLEYEMSALKRRVDFIGQRTV